MEQANRDAWTNPVDFARTAADCLLSLTEQGDWSRLETVRQLRDQRTDAPLLLAVTERALDPESTRAAHGLRRVLASIDDPSWITRLVDRLVDFNRIGVLSLEPNTLAVLETLAQLAINPPELVVDRSMVGRGLGYLRLPLHKGKPEHTQAMLLPVLAADRGRSWVYRAWAERAGRAQQLGCQVVEVLHPAAVLSPLNRSVFHPPAGFIAVPSLH